MSEIAFYETEFVRRTQSLLRDYKGEYKLSNAINCMLGLIILPNEMLELNHNEIWDMLIEQIQELQFLRIQTFEPIRRKNRLGVPEYYPKNLKTFLKKVRNGLAHQNIIPVNTKGIFSGVIIRNYFGAGKKDLDLDVKFNRKELERFALYVAGKYLGD
jgi:hypothetical protein